MKFNLSCHLYIVTYFSHLRSLVLSELITPMLPICVIPEVIKTRPLMETGELIASANCFTWRSCRSFKFATLPSCHLCWAFLGVFPTPITNSIILPKKPQEIHCFTKLVSVLSLVPYLEWIDMCLLRKGFTQQADHEESGIHKEILNMSWNRVDKLQTNEIKRVSSFGSSLLANRAANYEGWVGLLSTVRSPSPVSYGLSSHLLFVKAS